MSNESNTKRMSMINAGLGLSALHSGDYGGTSPCPSPSTA
jgi:hypothetical protein